MSTPSPYIVGRIPKLPPKYALIVMPLLMSGMMSGIICMVNLVRALGWSRAALAAWPGTSAAGLGRGLPDGAAGDPRGQAITDCP